MPQPRLLAVIRFLQDYGRPARMSFDHDPRWVGGSSGWDFPSADASLFAGGGSWHPLVPASSAPNERVCREVSSQLQV